MEVLCGRHVVVVSDAFEVVQYGWKCGSGIDPIFQENYEYTIRNGPGNQTDVALCRS